MKKQRLICDLDDVLWEMVPVWCEQYNIIMDDDISPNDLYCWDLTSVLGEEKANAFYEILHTDEFWDMVVYCQYPHGLNATYTALLRLMTKYDVYITTATSYKNKHKMELFFELFDYIPENHVVLIHDKWIIYADIVIDDNPEILKEFKKLGKRCVKINKPWNQNFDCENYKHFIYAVDKLMSEV